MAAVAGAAAGAGASAFMRAGAVGAAGAAGAMAVVRAMPVPNRMNRSHVDPTTLIHLHLGRVGFPRDVSAIAISYLLPSYGNLTRVLNIGVCRFRVAACLNGIDDIRLTFVNRAFKDVTDQKKSLPKVDHEGNAIVKIGTLPSPVPIFHQVRYATAAKPENYMHLDHELFCSHLTEEDQDLDSLIG